LGSGTEQILVKKQRESGREVNVYRPGQAKSAMGERSLGAYREEIWRLEFSSKLMVKRTVSTDVQDVRTPKHSTEFNLQKMNLIGI
jgi:hypothetical protein